MRLWGRWPARDHVQLGYVFILLEPEEGPWRALVLHDRDRDGVLDPGGSRVIDPDGWGPYGRTYLPNPGSR